MITTQRLESDIVDICNMRCRDCGHFASIYHKNSYSFDDFYKDVHQLSTVLHTEWFFLLGGEPTMVGKNLPKYIDVVRHSGICDNVGMNTNGVLLPKLESFIPLFDKIILSLYKSKHYNDLKMWLEEKKYPNIQIDDRDKFFLIFDGNRLTDSESDNSYKHCTAKIDCNFLHKGRYYKCAQSVKIWDLLRHKKLPFDVDESQIGVDLYQPNLEDRLSKFLNDGQKTLACSWCYGTSGKKVAWEEE
jgi:organic radical activating enzyme